MKKDYVRFFDKGAFAMLLLLALAGILLIYSAGHSTQETYYLKQVAQNLVYQLDGVDAVDNRLDVVSPPLSRPRSGNEPPMTRTWRNTPR